MTLSEFSKHFEGKSLEEIKAEASKEGFDVKADQRDAAIAELFAAVETRMQAEAKALEPKAPKSPSADKPRKSPSADKAPPAAPSAPAPAVAGPVQYEGRSLTGGPFLKAGFTFMPGKWHDLGEVDGPTLAVLERYRKVGHIAFRIKG